MDKNSESSPPASFSASRRWGIFFSVVISIVTVIALVVMVNYLGARYYKRVMLSRQTDNQLSLRTVALLKSITNQVNVVIYFDKGDNLYSSVAALLNEYRLTNPKISVRTVDYLFNAGEAQQVKSTYKLGSGQDKNVVIFECNGRQKVVLYSDIGDYSIEHDGDSTTNYVKRLKAFDGERRFSSALMNVTSARTRKAYFLEDHGEHTLASDSADGYLKVGLLLEENSIVPGVIRLFGTNTIPADCSLLVIAGPRKIIPAEELAKIEQYLKGGGRLFVLFNRQTQNLPTGLEAILAAWNVKVGMNIVGDPQFKTSGDALAVNAFNPNQPISKNLLGSRLLMLSPRSIQALNTDKPGPESAKVTVLASTSEGATLNGHPAGGPVPLIVAVEKENIQGVFPENASTAMVVAGDSTLLDNELIDANGNGDFAALAVNWLVDQRELMQGIGPHPIKEYKLMMTAGQMKSVDWIFLAAMPGGILAAGGLVWFRRRR